MAGVPGFDPARLFAQLNNTGLQNKDNPLYQILYLLIQSITQLRVAINNGTSSGGGGGSSVTNITNIQQILGLVTDGIDGIDGIGIQGLQGIQGIPGPSGSGSGSNTIIPGIDGIDGEDAFPIPGLQGIPGVQGLIGPSGISIPGIDGEDGFDGFPGTVGIQGLVGPTGLQGIPGIDGIDAEDPITFPPSSSSGSNAVLTNIFATILPPIRFCALYASPSNVNSFDSITFLATAIGGSNTIASDNRHAWQLATTAGIIGNSAGMRMLSNFARAEWNPVATFLIKTGPIITNCRFWIGFTDQTSVPTIDNPITTNLIILRYSAGVDTSWVGVCQTPTAQTVSNPIGTIAINTEYLIYITVIGTTLVQFTVNGITENVALNIPVSTPMKLVMGITDKTAIVHLLYMCGWFCQSA